MAWCPVVRPAPPPPTRGAGAGGRGGAPPAQEEPKALRWYDGVHGDVPVELYDEAGAFLASRSRVPA